MISGICHGVNEISKLVRFYTTQNRSLLATLGDSLLVPSSEVTRWVVPKRQLQNTILHCVKSQKNVDIRNFIIYTCDQRENYKI